MITREEWLQQAVIQLDIHVFNGALDLVNHNFQIACGRCPGKKKTETIQPNQSELASMDDFFPTTINVDFKIKDPEEIMVNLAHECIKAFMGETKGKRFAKLCESYYFEPPYKYPNPSAHLLTYIKQALQMTIQQCGEWPGKAVVFPVKEPKEKTSNKITFFCPECGWEVYTTKKQMKNRNGMPTCMCGAHMGIAQDEDKETTNAEDQN